jgi:transposase InsO family protein
MHISDFEFRMEAIYEYCGISRQGHHQAKKLSHHKNLVREDVLRQVRQARLSHPRMGSRPLHKMLGISDIGINQFERLLSAEGLCIKRRRNRCKTTDGHLFKGKVTNLINGKVLDEVNQLWVSDITYFQRSDKVFYIILLMDVYSRMILGSGIYTDMFSDNNLLVLRSCLKQRGIKDYGGNLIHHSDKGSQYMSKAYKEMLKKHGIELSVAENSLQNAYAERLNGIIKNDYLQFFHTEDLPQLRRHLKRSVWLYNHKRPHSALKYMTPVEYEDYLKNGEHEKMTLYDFSPKIVDEFFSGIGNRNDSASMIKKQTLNLEPVIPVGQRYSFVGCSPAEPSSASLCQCKSSNNQKS